MDSVEAAILRGRRTTPSHYLLKIRSFSLLSKTFEDDYMFDSFEAAGYTWNFCIYLDGDKTKNGKDHISLYLELDNTTSLPVGWELKVIVNFFIFNQLLNKYFSYQDGRVRRYHAMKKTWGITKFIDLKTFSDPLNGYLIDNTCVFGAEVFVVKNTFKGALLTMKEELATHYYTWELRNFSTLVGDYCYKSETFGSYKWKINLLPNGCFEGRGNSISLALSLDKSNIPANSKLVVGCKLRVKDQINRKHYESIRNITMYYPPNHLSWGCKDCMSLAKLKDPTLGFLVDDTFVIEAEVTFLGMILTD